MDKPFVYPEPAIGCGSWTCGQTDVPVQSIVVPEILPANFFHEASKRADVTFDRYVSPSTANFRQHKGVALLYYSLSVEKLEADMSRSLIRYGACVEVGSPEGGGGGDGVKFSKCFACGTELHLKAQSSDDSDS